MTRKTPALFLLALWLLSAATVMAQVAEKKTINLDGARRVIGAAINEAKAKGAPGAVIAVVDDGGNLIALERLDGTIAAGARISIGKARTAALFKRPTKFFEDVIRNGRTPMVALDDFTPLQGGIPIEVDGQVIGGVGVSGAASAQQDEELAIAGASAVKSPAAKEAARVSYFDREKVNAAFAKGSVLFNQSDQFEVHTSRRDAAGLAEIHATDSDIFYILSGRATLVTGGTLVAPQQVAANEVRGREISGGETRQIVKGDVIIIPAGTPHWFKEVPEPITYYTVKSR